MVRTVASKACRCEPYGDGSIGGITFVLGRFWSEAKGLLAMPVDETALPTSLLARFAAPGTNAVTAMLRLIAPVTTASVEAPIAMPM